MQKVADGHRCAAKMKTPKSYHLYLSPYVIIWHLEIIYYVRDPGGNRFFCAQRRVCVIFHCKWFGLSIEKTNQWSDQGVQLNIIVNVSSFIDQILKRVNVIRLLGNSVRRTSQNKFSGGLA